MKCILPWRLLRARELKLLPLGIPKLKSKVAPRAGRVS